MFRNAVLAANYVYIVGKMCSGKTTLADEIQRYVYKSGRPVFRYALATPIKRMDAARLINDAMAEVGIFETEEMIQKAIEIERSGDKRRYYQYVGNDLIRSRNPVYFERVAIRAFPPIMMQHVSVRPLVIVDDVRWPISLTVLPKGISVKIEASEMAKLERGCDLSLSEHASEQEVDEIVTDFYVMNNGEPYELLNKVTKVARGAKTNG